MDYQIVFKNHHLLVIFVLIMFSFLPFSLAIINRDLILTPKPGLQLSGKRIFYEESFNNDALHNNDSVTRPWERTLKHVTYLTLFTNAANGIITGNFSKVKEYNDFLQSPYVHAENPHDTRFGDIVTLAQGRLDIMSNGSHRFVEGNCDYECARNSDIIAVWHVQKIRHRDTQDRKYHYEMKFSVSPWTAKTPTETVVRGGPTKRTITDEKSNNMQTFIQKDVDYPHSFSKIVSETDEDFADRRFDATRNFRQVNPYQQVTPIPQGTFLRGVYRPPPQKVQPQQMHLPERLNMGEYYKGMYVPKAPPKNDIIPNILNMLLGKPQNHSPPPTTFRPPTYQMKFPKPEIHMVPQQQSPEYSKFPEYHHHLQEHFTQKVSTQHPMAPQQQSPEYTKFPEYHHHSQEHFTQKVSTHNPMVPQQQQSTEYTKFPEYFTQKVSTHQPMVPQQQTPEYPKFPEYHHHSQEHFTQKVPTQNPLVTHHFHHHFFMPNNSAANSEHTIQHSGEQKYVNPGESSHPNEVTEGVTSLPYITNVYEHQHTTTLRQPEYQQHHYQQPQQQQHYYLQLEQQQYQQPQQHQYQHSQKHPYQQPQQHQFQQPQPPQYHHVQEHMPPAPQKFIFPHTQIEQHRVVHVTPAPPLRKPQYQHYYQNQQFTMQPEYTDVQVPFYISYPAPVNEEERADVPTPRNKPFLESQPLDVTIRYSEPDPLYAHLNHNDKQQDAKYSSTEGQEEMHDTNHEPQLESPDHYNQHHQNEHETELHLDNSKQHSDSVEAQLPAPNNSKNVPKNVDETKTTYEDSTQSQTKQQELYEQITSQSTTSVKLSTEKSTSSTIKTEASNTIVTATNKPKTFPSRAQRISLKTATTTSPTTTTTTTTTTIKPKTTSRKKPLPKSTKIEKEKSMATITSKTEKHFVSKPSTEFPTTTSKPGKHLNSTPSNEMPTTTTSKPRKQFVSTSSTESPLRALSRYRISNARSSSSTTTTEKPVLKWKPRRKNSNGKSMAMNNMAQETQVEDTNQSDDGDDIKAKESSYPVTKLLMFSSSTTDKPPDDIKPKESSYPVTKLLMFSSTTTEQPEPESTTTDMPNDIITMATSTISSMMFETQPPLATQSDTEIYEVLTQKSVSKSVSLKVGSDGEEISVIIDDQENEVTTV